MWRIKSGRLRGHIYRELEANGTPALSIRTDDFILKISVPKVAEKVSVTSGKVSVNVGKVSEKVTVNEIRSQKTS